MTRTGIGTVIGRKTITKQHEYRRVWIYVPTKLAEDSNFPFNVGDPCFLSIDIERKQLIVKTMSREKATKMGWRAKATPVD